MKVSWKIFKNHFRCNVSINNYVTSYLLRTTINVITHNFEKGCCEATNGHVTYGMQQHNNTYSHIDHDSVSITNMIILLANGFSG